MTFKIQLAKLLYWFLGFKEDPHELFKKLEVDSDDNILEIGYAIGFHTFQLADLAKDGEIYAVDISEDAVDYLKKKRGKDDRNITPICKDARHVDLQNKEFDKIVCFDTLHDLYAPKKSIEPVVEPF